MKIYRGSSIRTDALAFLAPKTRFMAVVEEHDLRAEHVPAHADPDDGQTQLEEQVVVWLPGGCSLWSAGGPAEVEPALAKALQEHLDNGWTLDRAQAAADGAQEAARRASPEVDLLRRFAAKFCGLNRNKAPKYQNLHGLLGLEKSCESLSLVGCWRLGKLPIPGAYVDLMRRRLEE